MVLQQSFVAALSFRSNVDCRCLQPLCRSLYLRMLVSQLFCNVFFSCLSRYSCFPFFSCSQPLCLLPCHPQLFCSFFFAAFFTVLIAAFFLLPNLSPQLSCFSLGHRQPFRSFFFAAFSPAVLHVVIFHLQPPLPLPPKPITAAVLLSPWTPAAVLQLCLCSLLRSCFACCDVSSAVSFSSSQHATAAVLQLFFAAISATVLHVAVSFSSSQPITAAVLLYSWSPTAVLQGFPGSLFRSCLACCDILFAASFLPPNPSPQLFCFFLVTSSCFAAFSLQPSAAVLIDVFF